LPIAVRSSLGFLVKFPWESQPMALIALTLAAVFGKALGGFLADRWGWTRVGIGAMVAALPFLAFSSIEPLAVIPGIFLINLTMPITLAAVVEALPGHPGFAFGLTCIAILFGAVPSLAGISFNDPLIVVLAVAFSAIFLYRGLCSLSFDPNRSKMKEQVSK
jgi:FSR family fosmidomycin resistance protein-like MFS transporter